MLKIRGKSCSLSALVLKVDLTSSANLTRTSDSYRISWQISCHKRQQMLSKTSKRREYNYGLIITRFGEKVLGICSTWEIARHRPIWTSTSSHNSPRHPSIPHASQIFQMQFIVIFGQNIAQFRKLIWLPNRKYLKTKWHKNRLSKLFYAFFVLIKPKRG